MDWLIERYEVVRKSGEGLVDAMNKDHVV